MRRHRLSAGLTAVVLILPAFALGQPPEKVTVCELQSDPSAYNHKLVIVDSFVSHGFEDFTLFDPTCRDFGIWLEYGGTRKSDTMYCCGVAAGTNRPKPLIVENIRIPLTDDENFRKFDREIQAPFRSGDFGSVVHAKLIGRFFAGVPRSFPGGNTMRGYGHMGCCSLLAIQEIVSIDPQDRIDLDYGASGDDPDIGNDGCGGYQYLTPIFPGSEVIEMQRKADSDAASIAFDQPEDVAREYLTSREKLASANSLVLKIRRKAGGRLVYDGLDPSTGARFMIVMSRPYLLSFYARNPMRVAWVPLAAFRLTLCN